MVKRSGHYSGVYEVTQKGRDWMSNDDNEDMMLPSKITDDPDSTTSPSPMTSEESSKTSALWKGYPCNNYGEKDV